MKRYQLNKLILGKARSFVPSMIGIRKFPSVAGTDGTISSYDYDAFVTVQTSQRPVAHRVAAPATRAPNQNPVQYLIDCLEQGKPLEGPVSIRVSRIGQEIVDAAVRSAKLKRAVKLS